MKPDLLYRIQKADEAADELLYARGAVCAAQDVLRNAQERLRRAEYTNTDAAFELLRALKKETK
jgi:hypothetical protein